MSSNIDAAFTKLQDRKSECDSDTDSDTEIENNNNHVKEEKHEEETNELTELRKTLKNTIINTNNEITEFSICSKTIKNNSITKETFNSIIKEVDYINNCFSNKKKDISSLSYLVDTKLSQSDNIKLGIAIEHYLTQSILRLTSFDNIKKPNKKGIKEKDILFLDKNKKVIYYTEIKSNLNLDTEKCKSTYLKCLSIIDELSNQYSSYELRWCLLGARYISHKEIPITIKNKYRPIYKNLFGINDFLKMYKIHYIFNEINYKKLINNIANACFNNSL